MPPHPESARRCRLAIEGRAADGGGFSGMAGGDFRPDATAWAILALRAMGASADRLYPARQRLAEGQAADGSVPIGAAHPGSVWPTPLAVLAWHGAAPFADARAKAVAFLLDFGGVTWERRPDEAEMAVDPRIRGWAWATGTFSWVEPTALALMALGSEGHSGHERVREAIAVLRDRQVSTGGWNVGSTRVFREEQGALPEMTGMALAAMRGHVRRDDVAKAFAYLSGVAGRHRTPLALGWCLLGLAAWGEAPDAGQAWIDGCLDRQDFFGPYETSQLALLALAALAHDGDVGLLLSGGAT